MASVGHVILGMAAARVLEIPRLGLVPRMVLLAGVSLAPDLDVVAFAFGVPYEAPFGHRGASHSLAAALLGGAIAALLLSKTRARAFAVIGALLASHGLLDMLTDGGMGVALFWPLSTERLFFPWTPIPVSPIGRAFLGPWGLRVVLTELLWFWPILLWAVWPRRWPTVRSVP